MKVIIFLVVITVFISGIILMQKWVDRKSPTQNGSKEDNTKRE
jgi:hypothetical protein